MGTALEGGIGYWCKADIEHGSDDPLNDFYYKSFGAYDTEEFDEDDEDASYLGNVNYETIALGIERILTGKVKVSSQIVGWILEDVVAGGEAGSIDADAADCIVQAGLLNEIRYG